MSAKHALKALGLALIVALGLTALVAPGAGAVKGKIAVLKLTNLKAKVTGIINLDQFLVPALSVEKHCEKGSVVSAEITDPELGEILGTLLFENCKIYPINGEGKLTSAEPLPCIVSNGGANHHITIRAFLLVIKHEGVKYLVAESDPSTSALTTITYEAGKGCPIPLKQEIKSNYAFEVTQTEAKVLTITAGTSLTQAKAVQVLLGTKLQYGINEAVIIGKGTAELLAPHAGCTWGVV